MLHDERYTIEGAKRRLRGGGAGEAEEDVVDLVDVADSGETDGEDESQMALPLGESRYREELLAMKRELEEIRALLCD